MQWLTPSRAARSSRSVRAGPSPTIANRTLGSSRNSRRAAARKTASPFFGSTSRPSVPTRRSSADAPSSRRTRSRAAVSGSTSGISMALRSVRTTPGRSPNEWMAWRRTSSEQVVTASDSGAVIRSARRWYQRIQPKVSWCVVTTTGTEASRPMMRATRLAQNRWPRRIWMRSRRRIDSSLPKACRSHSRRAPSRRAASPTCRRSFHE